MFRDAAPAADSLFSLTRFRRIAAENRERERERAEAFAAWWAEHGDARTRLYEGLRGLPVPHDFTEG
jgi:hypothetical protein